MMIISKDNVLKMIILFILINGSLFEALHPTGGLRLIMAMLMNIAGVLLIIYFIKLNKKNLDASIYFKFLFILLITWSFITIFRSFELDSKRLISLFGNLIMGWTWLTPLAVVFGFNIKNWLMLFDFLGKILIVYSIGSFIGLVYPLSEAVAFSLLDGVSAFLPVLFLTYLYQSKQNRLIAIFSYFAFIILSYYASQRTNVVIIVLLVVFLIFESYRESMLSAAKKVLITLLLIFTSIVIMIKVDTYISEISHNDKATTDTRTFLIEEMYADMSTEELILGRGAMGTYYSPYFASILEQGMEGDSSTRSVNEIGYLEIVLKGGYIMAALYVLIMLPAAFLGIFRSKNIIAKMSGYTILLYLILWSVSYFPEYTVKFIILWMAVGTAISKKARNITNKELIEKIKGRYQFVKQ